MIFFVFEGKPPSPLGEGLGEGLPRRSAMFQKKLKKFSTHLSTPKAASIWFMRTVAGFPCRKKQGIRYFSGVQKSRSKPVFAAECGGVGHLKKKFKESFGGIKLELMETHTFAR